MGSLDDHAEWVEISTELDAVRKRIRELATRGAQGELDAAGAAWRLAFDLSELESRERSARKKAFG